VFIVIASVASVKEHKRKSIRGMLYNTELARNQIHVLVFENSSCGFTVRLAIEGKAFRKQIRLDVPSV